MLLDATHWFFFSVFLALFHFVIGALVWYLHKQAIPFHTFVEDGSLLFFAATLTATGFGDYLKTIPYATHPWVSLGAFVGLILILMPTSAIYGVIISALCTKAKDSLSPAIILRFSSMMASAAVVYGLALFVIVTTLVV